VEKLRGDMASYSFTDAETEKTIVDVYAQYGYMMCPHTAVGYLGLTKYLKEESRKDLYGVLLSTAHPAKFVNELRPEIAAKVSVPKELSDLLSRKKEAKFIQPEFEQLKSFLLNK
jgi:threonine synthase